MKYNLYFIIRGRWQVYQTFDSEAEARAAGMNNPQHIEYKVKEAK